MPGGRLFMCNTNAHNVERMCIAAYSAPAPKTVARYAQRLALFAHNDKPPTVASVIFLSLLSASIYKEENNWK
jgi:hypothetical protein